MEVQQGQPLLAVAEGIEAERQALRRLRDAKTEKFLGMLENLIKVSGAKALSGAACVLRWIAEHGGLDAGAELDAETIAADAWVSISKRTVYRRLEFWENVHGRGGPVLRKQERCDTLGRALPAIGKIDLEAVSTYLLDGFAPSVTLTQPVSQGHNQCQGDTGRVTQTQPVSHRHSAEEEEKRISEAEVQARQALILQQLAQADATAPDLLHGHEHDSIDKGAHLPPTSMKEHGVMLHDAPCRIVRTQRMGDWESRLNEALIAPGPLRRETLMASFREAIALLAQYAADHAGDGLAVEAAKMELVDLLARVVNCPDTNSVLFERVANQVILGNLDTLRLAESLVDQVGVAKSATGFKKSPGAWFNFRMAELFENAGLVWARKKPEAVAVAAQDPWDQDMEGDFER
jgi:hypothetical protein